MKKIWNLNTHLMSFSRLEIGEKQNIAMEGTSDIFSKLRYIKKWNIQIK